MAAALPIEDLDWPDDGTPAMHKGEPYTGWITQSSDPVFGVAFLSDGIDDGPFLLIHPPNRFGMIVTTLGKYASSSS